jgi:hypothetical protein
VRCCRRDAHAKGEVGTGWAAGSRPYRNSYLSEVLHQKSVCTGAMCGPMCGAMCVFTASAVLLASYADGTTRRRSSSLASATMANVGLFEPNHTITLRTLSPTIVSIRQFETFSAGWPS